ncbi:LamG-like jellyroll fold domain-containing protein [Luteimicrobium sp. DT211]|uniref:LamG-like jellyroll fold domain-containing protein n=1 Tax=Luteimicrobium sp. DT211 TaxID=3393412 RepID=UPI003CFB8B92
MERTLRRLTAAGASAALAVVGLAPVLAWPAHAAEQPAAVAAGLPAPVVDYTFDDAGPGTTTLHNSGSGGAAYDGTVVNAAALKTGTRDGAGTLTLPGGPQGTTDSTMPYVKIPNGLYRGAKGVTVSTWVKWDGKNVTSVAPWTFILGGDKLPNNNYGVFWAPSENGKNSAAANDGAEYKINAADALPSDRWMHLTLTEDGSQLVMYVNGVRTDARSAPIDLGKLYSASSTYSGLIGRTQWTQQYATYFGGQLDDFRVYDTALTAEQVAGLGEDVATLTGVAPGGVQVTTATGVAPTLPATVNATYSDGYDRPVAVTWDVVDPGSYAHAGSFTVHGTTAVGEVTATVEVKTDNQVDIDLAKTTGDFMGGAVGTLYGLYGQDIPSNNVIDGIKLRTVATKAQDGPQHPGADALEVLKPLVDSSGGDVYIYMTDIYRGFPYEWPGDTPQARLADFEAKMRTQVEQVASLPEKYRSHVVFVPFNEPEGNMFGTGTWSYNKISWLNDPQYYFKAWDDAYALIKDRLPDARIAGPNTSVLYTQVQGFLEHALAQGTMPDVVTWHELSDPASIRTNVAKFRSWEDSLYKGTAYEGKHLPINIDEYAFNYHTSVPGQMIQWVSALEDAKVDGDVAYWNIDGNVSDSAVQANRGNGQWWLFNAYGQMTGKTVQLTPPHPNRSYTLQGVATLDTSRKQAKAIIGGASGNSLVNFQHVDAATFGPTAHVSVKEIGWSGQVGDSSGPRDVAELNVPVTSGSLALAFGEGDLPVLDAESAYVITVTPGANADTTTAAPDLWRATYEAEDAAHSGTGYTKNGPEGTTSNVSGFYTSGGYDVGGLRAGSDVKLAFTVDVPRDGTYDLSVFANSLNTYDAVKEQGPTNVFLTVDGQAEQELYLPLGYKWVVWDHTDTTVHLTAGKHTLTLAARSLDGSKVTQGDAIVDKIDLALPDPKAATQVYEGENAELDGAVADYTRTGVSGSGAAALGTDGSATFWVYGKDDAERSLSVDTLGSGTATLTVNGQRVGTIGSPVTVPVFLSGGINKVTVTGAGGNLLVDRVRVGASGGHLAGTTVQGEDATVSGGAKVASYPLAQGGKALTGIGGEPGNDNAATFTVSAKAAGTYAVTVRYSNGEQSVASHYNPDPLARHADVSVNGGDAQRVWFPFTFHDDNFYELTFYATLAKGANTLRFGSEELPNFDGTTYISDTYPDIDLRSPWAPNIDALTVTPFADAAAIPAAWDAKTAYQTGATVAFGGSTWTASWWTQNQKPGDPYGPWQEVVTAVDGTAVWTASRIFDSGDTVAYHGATYVAKWWTRNQKPGDANGPWRKLG